MGSPFADLSVSEWAAKTDELIDSFPMASDEVVAIVLECWISLYKTRIGSKRYSIGKDIFPSPQIIGFFLHELIPLEFESRYPDTWSRDYSGYGKDIICKRDVQYSCEIKPSSNKSQILGNRSHAQVGNSSKKDKSGYYLAVNFEKGSTVKSKSIPVIRRIRLRWLDSSDWHGQNSATGQQARLLPDAAKFKLKELYFQK